MAIQLDETSLRLVRFRRLSKFAEIEAIVKELDSLEFGLSCQLKDATPTSVEDFVESEGVITELIKYGRSIRTISYFDNNYGFNTLRKVKKVFSELKKAWCGAVVITFTVEAENRVRVEIRVP